MSLNILLRGASPAEGILETAETQEVDLIVMSTHGRSGLTRWALGSVADKVMCHSHCPVLLVRQTEEDHSK
jgi:nucleotide-binding universal stress UspA family protein